MTLTRLRAYISRKRRERFWNDHHTPLDQTGEEMTEEFRNAMKPLPDEMEDVDLGPTLDK